MAYETKKQVIIKHASDKLAELKTLYLFLKDDPGKEAIVEKIVNDIYRLRELIDPEEGYIDDEQRVKNEFPILYFDQYDFNDETIFYSQIVNNGELEILARDRDFISLLATAPCRETLNIFITLVQEAGLDFDPKTFFNSPEEEKPDVLDALFFASDDWNGYHLTIRNEAEKQSAIGERLRYLTTINNDLLKIAIFTSHRVLRTLKDPEQPEDEWFFSQQAGKLPEYANLKIMQYLLNRKIFHFNYINEIVHKCEVVDPSLKEYKKILKLK